MDLADDCLAELDVVIASVHSAFNQDEAQMTERMLRAISNPFVDIIGHPTGRILLRREPYKLDINAVIDAAAAAGVALEINCPGRSPGSVRRQRQGGARSWREARHQHRRAQQERASGAMKWGVQVARRAWLTKDDVLNTRDSGRV